MPSHSQGGRRRSVLPGEAVPPWRQQDGVARPRRQRIHSSWRQSQQLTRFWHAHDPSGVIHQELRLLKRLIFGKRKHAVSEKYVLQQLKDTLELRHEFLLRRGLEVNHVLQDDTERRDFVMFVKRKYHNLPEQQQLQARDAKKGGNRKKRDGMHKRWGLEMQRRCGNKGVWEVVSFTGKYRVATLANIPQTDPPERDAAKLSNQKQRTRNAHRARAKLR